MKRVSLAASALSKKTLQPHREMLAMSRRGMLTLAGGLAVSSAWAAADDFADYLKKLWPDAQARGVGRETFDALLAGLKPDLTLPRSGAGQPEFERPLQAYYREAVSAGRIAQGRSRAAAYADALAAGEGRFGVPGEICLAAWGMESDYGRARGTRDVLRTVATLAWTRRDRPMFRDEVVAALVILDRRLVAREQLVGSWAGAMGDPQFLPSAYLKYAVSASAGAATADIWHRPPDILASIANFMHIEGWTAGEPWIEEVLIPDGFDYPTLHASGAEWSRLGVRKRAGGSPEGGGDAALFLPAGAAGPAFLLYANYFVIKQYNNSDAYALSLGSLAQASPERRRRRRLGRRSRSAFRAPKRPSSRPGSRPWASMTARRTANSDPRPAMRSTPTRNAPASPRRMVLRHPRSLRASGAAKLADDEEKVRRP